MSSRAVILEMKSSPTVADYLRISARALLPGVRALPADTAGRTELGCALEAALSGCPVAAASVHESVCAIFGAASYEAALTAAAVAVVSRSADLRRAGREVVARAAALRRRWPAA